MMASHAAMVIVPGRTYRNIAGTLALEMLHCSAGVSVNSGNTASWTGRFLGLVIPAPSVPKQPPYAADGTIFGGKPVIQIALSGLKYLRATGLAVLFASGTKPWTFAIGRYRIANASLVSVLVDAGITAVSDDASIRVGASNKFEANTTGYSVCVGGTADTARHSFQQWLDGASLNLSIDNGAPTQVGAVGNITHSTTTLALGCAAGAADVQVSTTSLALYFACSAKPAAARVAEINALGLAEFPP